MNIVILDVSEMIHPVYTRYGIDDDGNLLRNVVTTAMFTLFISGGSPEAKHQQLISDLQGYVSNYTSPAYGVEATVAIAKACFDIITRLINQHAMTNTTRITVLDAVRHANTYTMRIGYLQC